MVFLSGEKYKLQTSDTMKEFIDFFMDEDELDDTTKAMTENAKKIYDQIKKIPEDEYKEYVIFTSNVEAAWEVPREKSDFDLFKPHLEKLVKCNQKFIKYLGYDKNKYDTLLNLYEPGITVEKLDVVFRDLREAIVCLYT